MIRRTFQIVRGIGPAREREFWARGIRSWDEFPAHGQAPAYSAAQDDRIRGALGQADVLLARGDISALTRLFPSRERWRLYAAFASQAVFFDIETDASAAQNPTVVSLFHAEGFEVFIAGRNLDRLPEALERWKVWVTFNGSGFDVPVLESHFPRFPKPALHLDLRFICQRLELRGGLKKIEERLGFGRPPHLQGVDGYDAVLLWRAYRESGDVGLLRLLAEYNLYDSIQLRTLMDTTYNRSVEQLGVEAERLPVFERGEVLYDISRYLLSLGPEGDRRQVLDGMRRLGRREG